jgi:hypothetical protein
MNTDEELQQLIRTVQILDVRLLEAAVRTRISGDQVRPSELIADHQTHASDRVDETGKFHVTAALRLRVVPRGAPGGEDRDEDIAIRIVTELTYRVPPESSFSPGALKAFAKTNGLFNVWPYWRHYVQSTSVLMGLPPLVMPVYRVPRRVAQDPTSQARDPHAEAAPKRVSGTRQATKKR